MKLEMFYFVNLTWYLNKENNNDKLCGTRFIQISSNKLSKAMKIVQKTNFGYFFNRICFLVFPVMYIQDIF